MIFGMILLPVAIISLFFGWRIWIKGESKLINSYHQENVTDMEGYTSAMGKTLFVQGIGLLMLTAFALLEMLSVIILTIILVVVINSCVVSIIIIQRKFNGGIF